MKKILSKISKMDILRIVLSLFLVMGVILPVIFLFINIDYKDIGKVFGDANILKITLNSLLATLLSSIISVFIAVVSAYFLDRSNIKHKNVFVILLTIPMLIPSISHALGLINLFGKNGFLDKLFGIGVEIYGLAGIVIASVMYTFPIAFLMIYDALRYEDKQIYDASITLGGSRFRSFFAITLPYLKNIIISAFFATFTLAFTDYGVPLAIGGKFATLPVFLYQEVINRMNFSTGSIIGIILLIPAVIAFLYDLFRKETNSDEQIEGRVKSSLLFNIMSYTILIVLSLFIILPQISFAITSFVKSFPNDMSFTLDHLKYAFKNGASDYYINSLIIALFTGIIGTIIAYFTAYLTTRVGGKTGKFLNFVSIISLSIPGMVLGLGFIFVFKNTFIYGTIIILILVNIIHFFSSPYLLAKNAFDKINKNFETVGSTLGISRFKILKDVLIPNTKNTIIDMFSYFFINSMITISAVTFLYTIYDMPLALLIPQFESQLSYEAAAIVSLLILFTNIIVKIIINVIKDITNKFENKESRNMSLTRYQFDFLSYLEREGKGEYTQRKIADDITISLGMVNKLLNDFLNDGVIAYDDNKQLYITNIGLDMLEPYRVKKAIIIAAGLGSRLIPVTLDTPKPLITINGTRLIDTLLDSLIAADIKDIYIVRGYKKEAFNQLLDKYPFIKFIDNDDFNVANNISSIYAAKDYINECYICEADFLISNPKIITKYQYTTNYLAAPVHETDDWCFYKRNGYINKMAIGGEDCYHMIGISYWSAKDSEQLVKDIDKVYHSRGGKENYWDNVPLRICKKDFKIEIRECEKTSLVEIDRFDELQAIAPEYNNYKTTFKY